MSQGVGVGNPDVLNNPTLRDEQGACHGCPHNGAKPGQPGTCLFHLRKMGGFKNNRRFETKGRHNIGYQLLTDRTERYAAKLDVVACDVFCDTLQDRMITGRNLREMGKDGEIIRVCAQEGELIDKTFSVGFNVRGEIVRPMPDLIESLRAAGYKVNLDDLNVSEFRKVKIRVPVPAYVLVSQAHDATAAGIMDDIRAAEALESEIEEEVFAEAQRRVAAEVVKPDALPPKRAGKPEPPPLASPVA